MEIKLPTKKVTATYVDPHIMLFYGPPKVGKTTILSQLDDCLIIDLEDGTKYLDSLRVQVIGLKKPVESDKALEERQKKNQFYFDEVGKAIHEKGKPYKYVAIDTVTKLEEWCEWEGTSMYMSSVQGKNFNRDNAGNILSRSKWNSVLTLPNGAGYMWLRSAMKDWLDKIFTLAPHIILVGHLLDKMIEKKGKEVNAKDIDLTGKLKRIVCAQADAVGYLYRTDGKLYINFQSADEVNCGSRCDHLKGQNVEFSWKKIYTSQNK
tara:strand:- start:498 stop:1289 length:792 start_codon:yes stop_codon:yes gene_type:complete